VLFGWAHLLGVLNGVTTNGVTVGGHHRQGCEDAAVCVAKNILQSDEEGPPFLNKILSFTALIGG
jgi:hypothetical protein